MDPVDLTVITKYGVLDANDVTRTNEPAKASVICSQPLEPTTKLSEYKLLNGIKADFVLTVSVEQLCFLCAGIPSRPDFGVGDQSQELSRGEAADDAMTPDKWYGGAVACDVLLLVGDVVFLV